MQRKKVIKLINDEHVNPKVVSAMGCDTTSTDSCSEQDDGECMIHSVDICSKDLAGCMRYATDKCNLDRYACSGMSAMPALDRSW